MNAKHLTVAVAAAALVLVVVPAAEAARSSKPKEIVVVGSKVKEVVRSNYAEQADRLLAASEPLILRLRAVGRDDLADEAERRVSERLRHKTRVALALIDGITDRTLRLLALHGGTAEDVDEVQRDTEAVRAAILATEQRILDILVGL
jgi:hypothetical protein